ncbi:hypothetical protein HWV62_6739 [Athelia sp. TMB]|nr:hypothetical protein HWV62_6739 [Athelia sp. TMB]
MKRASRSRSTTPYNISSPRRSVSSSSTQFSSNGTLPELLPVREEDEGEHCDQRETVPVRVAKRALSPHEPSTAANTTSPKSKRRRCKAPESASNISITGKLKVESIQLLGEIPTSWTVPRSPIAYLVDASDSGLTNKSGEIQSVDAFIRSEDRELWGGSSGHKNGDSHVSGFGDELPARILCRRAHLTCNGVNTCNLFDESLFKNCERFEPDESAMRELWSHELLANENEALSVTAILAR